MFPPIQSYRGFLKSRHFCMLLHVCSVKCGPAHTTPIELTLTVSWIQSIIVVQQHKIVRQNRVAYLFDFYHRMNEKKACSKKTWIYVFGMVWYIQLLGPCTKRPKIQLATQYFHRPIRDTTHKFCYPYPGPTKTYILLIWLGQMWKQSPHAHNRFECLTANPWVRCAGWWRGAVGRWMHVSYDIRCSFVVCCLSRTLCTHIIWMICSDWAIHAYYPTCLR